MSHNYWDYSLKMALNNTKTYKTLLLFKIISIRTNTLFGVIFKSFHCFPPLISLSWTPGSSKYFCINHLFSLSWTSGSLKYFCTGCFSVKFSVRGTWSSLKGSDWKSMQGSYALELFIFLTKNCCTVVAVCASLLLCRRL